MGQAPEGRSVGPAHAAPRAAGLFSGLGGIESGLADAGFVPALLCESWAPARTVLAHRFPDVPVHDDVRTLRRVPDAELLVAGFPCTDLSLAGRLVGIGGDRSGLVQHVFRAAELSRPPWLLLENVPHMLGLQRGAAMRVITGELERLGYRWAYRTVDARFTGLPQRRPRVLVAAALDGDPAGALLAQDAGPPPPGGYRDDAFGFYWTEGRRGLGWVQDGVPPLKAGSTIGLQSAPAVWLPDRGPGRRFVLPTVAQGEALQGLRTGWTDAARAASYRDDHRWKLIGNAVPTRVARWAGERIVTAFEGRAGPVPEPVSRLDRDAAWPTAGWGGRDGAWASGASAWPVRRRYRHLGDLLGDGGVPLSHRAASGFLSRLQGSGLPHPGEFMVALKEHVDATRPGPVDR